MERDGEFGLGVISAGREGVVTDDSVRMEDSIGFLVLEMTEAGMSKFVSSVENME